MIALILFGMIANMASAACGGADERRPLDVIARDAEGYLVRREFAKLDQLVTEYRAKNSFSSDGQPKLMGFYAGVSKSNSNCRAAKQTDEQWEAHRRLLMDWNEASATSIAPKLSLAKFEAAYGWSARGGGYASTVSEANWVLFKQRIANAKAMLDKLRASASNDPYWYSAMLDVALAQGWEPEQFDVLYAQAVAKFPYYYAYYFTKGAFYSAKWHGSQKEFKTFVEETVAATESHLGQTMYARLNWSATRSSMFRDGQTDWKRMKQGFESILMDFPDAWNRNNFAKFACMARDKATLRQQLTLIGDAVSVAAWGDRVFFEGCKRFSEESGAN